MSRMIDLTHQKFGRLYVEGKADCTSSNGNMRWYCVCDCGKHVIVDGYSLRHGITKSCGCLRREVARKEASSNPAFLASQGNPLRNEAGIAYSSIFKGKRNRTGVIGVSFDTQSQRFVARMMYHGRYVLNHVTSDFNEAVRLRKEAEEKYFKQPVKREQ